MVFLLLTMFKWMLLLLGDAKRNCSKTELWLEPDLFNCTNKDFVTLESQVWNSIYEMKVNTCTCTCISEKKLPFAASYLESLVIQFDQ